MPDSSGLLKANSLAGTLTVISSVPCIVTAIRAANTTVADAYVQLFDAAVTTGITLGTTIADWWVLTDFGAGDISVGDGLPTGGLTFTRGVVAASTTTATGSTGATQHVRIGIK